MRLIDADALLAAVKVIGNRPLPDERTLKDLEQAIVNTYHAILNEITNAPTVQREGCERLYGQLAKQAYKLALLDTYLNENNIQPPTDNIFVKAGCEQFGVDVGWKTISGTRTFYGDGMVEAIFSVGKDEIVTVITHESVKDIAINYINQKPTVQREGWVSLTDMQITNIGVQHQSLHQVAYAISDALKQLNTKG